MMRHDRATVRTVAEALVDTHMPADAWAPARWWLGEANFTLGSGLDNPHAVYSAVIDASGVRLQGRNLAHIAEKYGAQRLDRGPNGGDGRTWLALVRAYQVTFPVWIIDDTPDGA